MFIELWFSHVRLLKLVYPKPAPRDQVTVLDMYRHDAFVLATSFANLTQFNTAHSTAQSKALGDFASCTLGVKPWGKAIDELSWDYELVSEQIGQCEWCDEHYLTRDGCEDNDGRGFCKRGCEEEMRFEGQFDAGDGEYDKLYDYYFPDGNPHDSEVPLW